MHANSGLIKIVDIKNAITFWVIAFLLAWNPVGNAKTSAKTTGIDYGESPSNEGDPKTLPDSRLLISIHLDEVVHLSRGQYATLLAPPQDHELERLSFDDIKGDVLVSNEESGILLQRYLLKLEEGRYSVSTDFANVREISISHQNLTSSQVTRYPKNKIKESGAPFRHDMVIHEGGLFWLYIESFSTNNYRLPIMVGGKEALEQYSVRWILLQASYIFILCAIAIWLTFLGILGGNKVAWGQWYLIFLFAELFWILSVTGVIPVGQTLGYEFSTWLIKFLAIFSAIAIIYFTVNYFYQLPQMLKRAKWAVIIVIGLFILATISNYFEWITALILLLIYTVVIALIFTMYLKFKSFHRNVFVLGLLTLLASYLWLGLEAPGIVNGSYWTIYGMQILSIIESVLLAISIVFRLKDEHRFQQQLVS